MEKTVHCHLKVYIHKSFGQSRYILPQDYPWPTHEALSVNFPRSSVGFCLNPFY